MASHRGSISTRREAATLTACVSLSGTPTRTLQPEDILMRTLTWVAALSAAFLMTHSAFAATAAARACAADIKAQCGDVMKAGGRPLKDCMKTHFSDLSEDCQVAIIRAAAVGKACKADARKLCADVKPGRGTVAGCLKSHAADLSGGCKEAMAKAQAGGK
jgi:hypothetical protein